MVTRNATALTANNSPAYLTASATSNNSTAFQAFDKSTGTYWTPSTNGSTESIKLDLGVDSVVNSLSILCTGMPTYELQSLTLKGSLDDSTYTTITTQTGLSGGWAESVYRTFTFANTTSYRFYQLICTLQSASPCRIVEVLFIKTDTSAFVTGETSGGPSFDPTVVVGSLTNLMGTPGSFSALSSTNYDALREGQLYPQPTYIV